MELDGGKRTTGAGLVVTTTMTDRGATGTTDAAMEIVREDMMATNDETTVGRIALTTAETSTVGVMTEIFDLHGTGKQTIVISITGPEMTTPTEIDLTVCIHLEETDTLPRTRETAIAPYHQEQEFMNVVERRRLAHINHLPDMLLQTILIGAIVQSLPHRCFYLVLLRHPFMRVCHLAPLLQLHVPHPHQR
jgi:hypothetical protein